MSPEEVLRRCNQEHWLNLKTRQNLFRRQRGLFAWKENGRLGEDIVFEKGSIVCSYGGVIVPTEQFHQILETVQASGDHQLNDLIKSYACGDRKSTILAHDENLPVVANSFGRLMNHSKHGNVDPPQRKVYGNHQVFLMRARRKIYYGEELTWNYGPHYFYGEPSFQQDCFNACCYFKTIQKYSEEYEAYKLNRNVAIRDEATVFESQKHLVDVISFSTACLDGHDGNETTYDSITHYISLKFANLSIIFFQR